MQDAAIQAKALKKLTVIFATLRQVIGSRNMRFSKVELGLLCVSTLKVVAQTGFTGDALIRGGPITSARIGRNTYKEGDSTPWGTYGQASVWWKPRRMAMPKCFESQSAIDCKTWRYLAKG
jgi:hypothetical protein